MNKSSLYAILMAAIFPILCYLVVKNLSETTIHMPRHYLPDTVMTQTKDGKSYSDTVWHTLPEISMTNQLGKKITWADLKGKVVIADFFFTHCPTICPGMTRNMKRLQESITNAQRVGDKTPDFLHFVSFSIDPERDSVERLKFWADKYQINSDQWWLLTGDQQKIYDLAIKEMRVPVEDGKGVDDDFQHTDHFILIDSSRHVRGYYHGLDTMELAQLSNDIILLSLEKDPKRKNFLSGQGPIIAVAFLAAMLGVGALLYFINKKKKNVDGNLEEKR